MLRNHPFYCEEWKQEDKIVVLYHTLMVNVSLLYDWQERFFDDFSQNITSITHKKSLLRKMHHLRTCCKEAKLPKVPKDLEKKAEVITLLCWQTLCPQKKKQLQIAIKDFTQCLQRFFKQILPVLLQKEKMRLFYERCAMMKALTPYP